ncbi:uncharacterized protein [Aegilops tauschii subsp. strangulata]|uniref:uncharacterized protein n=1 Tax=Aegilops tauschii subsp. strangulata TaxID=200361 RepID=UPI003CC86A93
MNWTLREFLICGPLSGDRHHVSFPPDLVDGGQSANGALLSDGELSPLKLVLVDDARARVEARVYSFETGTWGDIISTAEPCHLTVVPVTVVGNRLYCCRNSQIIPGEDGAVGLALLLYPNIEMWNRNIDSHGVATWVLRKTVVMDNFVDLTSSWAAWNSLVIGYAEDANAILISVFKERLHGHLLDNLYYPFAGFYNAGPSMRRILAHVNNDGGAGGAEA